MIIEARGAASAASAADAAIDHMHDWVLGAEGLVSMAVPSGGQYGVDEGLISSFPVRVSGGEYEIVGLDVGEFAAEDRHYGWRAAGRAGCGAGVGVDLVPAQLSESSGSNDSGHTRVRRKGWLDMEDDERMRRGEAANAADPIQNPWGAMIGDVPIGIAMFFWYPTEQALREALLSGEHAMDMEAYEWEPVRTALAPLLSHPHPFTDGHLAAARSVAKPAFEIRWWGQFDELCTGGSETALEFREEFLAPGDASESDPPRALADSERSPFGAYLLERCV